MGHPNSDMMDMMHDEFEHVQGSIATPFHSALGVIEINLINNGEYAKLSTFVWPRKKTDVFCSVFVAHVIYFIVYFHNLLLIW